MKVKDNIVLERTSLSVNDKLILDDQGRTSGGYRSVPSLSDMFQLPLNRRELGMQVYVESTNTLYTLINNRNGIVTVADDWAASGSYMGFAQEAIDILSNLNTLI